MNILVVDDDVIWLQTLKRGLRTRGYQTLEALDANQALEKLSNPNTPAIDLVLTDYLMSEINGIELLKEIRMNYGGYLPVIIMTAYAENSLLIEAFRNHCNGFIEKSSTLDQLMQEINRVMKKAKMDYAQMALGL
jgi:CheY-like chemotaxis protein